MKKLLFILTIISLQIISSKTYANGETPVDTTIISFSDNSLNKRVTVISTGEKDFDLPVSFNLKKLLAELGLQDEEVQRIINSISNANKNDTLNIVSQSGQRLQIIGTNTQSKTYEKDLASIDQPEDEWQSEGNTKEHTPETPPKFFPRSDFGLYLGLNNYKNSSSTQLNKLRGWNSRYVALSFRKNLTLAKSKNLDLAFSYGPEFAFYNFMFENSNIIINEDGQVNFTELDFKTKKSKLMVPYINIPILLSLGTKKEGFKLGIGGYVGYRIGSHTKTKDKSGNKEKNRDSFNLNKINYGLTSELGKKGGISFFFRYDLQPLFKSDQVNGKGLQAYSFGIRL